MQDFPINAFGSPAEPPRTEREAEQKKETDQRVLILRVVAAAATVLFVIMIAGLIVNFVSLGRLNARKKALRREIDSLNAQIAAGESMIENRTAESYIERYAREQLGMIGEGEILYIGTEPAE